MLRVTCLGLALLAIGTSSSFADHHGFVDLFNGENLDGWTQRNGTATYRVEGDAIVGTTSEGSPNSFLCTDKEYGDFELAFEVKLDNPLNSGVQIRSQTRGDDPQGRVNGPQVEIATNGNAGFIYGEAAGGWMTPDEAREPHDHFKENQWNSYRVVAFGPNIQVWLNGHQISDLTDQEKFESHPNGFIGLQVHGIPSGQGPYEVRWRNIRLRDLSDFEALYNGKDLSGWKTSGNWLPQPDGSLLIEPREGETGWQRYDAYLWSEKKYGDFALDLQYAYPPGGNSGVFFRVGDRDNPVEEGIEAQILDSSQTENALGPHDHGGIIRTAAPAKNMSQPPHEWNRMVITCVGDDLTVELNGEQIIEVDLSASPVSDRPRQGYIGLQDHGQPNNIRFRNIRVRDLD